MMTRPDGAAALAGRAPSLADRLEIACGQLAAAMHAAAPCDNVLTPGEALNLVAFLRSAAIEASCAEVLRDAGLPPTPDSARRRLDAGEGAGRHRRVAWWRASRRLARAQSAWWRLRDGALAIAASGIAAWLLINVARSLAGAP